MHKIVFYVFLLNPFYVYAAQDTVNSVCDSAAANGVSEVTKLLPGMAGPWDIAGSLIYVKCMYRTLNTQLQSMKKQNEFLNDVSIVSKESMRQYDAINNVKLEIITKRLQDDAQGLTMLDNMEGMEDRKKLETLTKEINRRIEDPATSRAEKKRLEELSSMAIALKRIEDLESAANANLIKASSGTTERESNQLMSQSMAILAKLQVLEDKRRYQEFIAKNNDSKAQNIFSQPSVLIDKVGSHSLKAQP